MKTIVKLIVVIGLSFQISAQDVTSKIFVNNEKQSIVKLASHVNLLNSLDFLIAPQFGSLFIESFRNVKGISNLKMFYDDFDLGLKLGIKYIILDKITFTSVYNIGMLRFNLEDSRGIEGAIIKASLCYNF